MKTRVTFQTITRALILGLVCLTILLSQGAANSWAQTDASDASFDVARLVAAGYAVNGPKIVTEFTPAKLALASPIGKDRVVSLKGKNLTVKDAQSNTASMSEIKKGTRVYVCRKGTEVLVFLVPEPERKEVGNDQ